MKSIYHAFFRIGILFGLGTSLVLAAEYPSREERTTSSGKHTWHIDPKKGDDNADGSSAKKAWKTMTPANKMIMGEGDTLVIHPGEHQESLVLMGEGSKKMPITVRFLPGRHIFKHGELLAEKPQISNTNDAPDEDKAIAIKLDKAKNVKLVGKPNASEILMEGKAIYINTDHSENIDINGLSFDYLHPTIGEYKVTKVEGNKVTAQIPEEILYSVDNGKLTWKGAGWEFPMGGYAKLFDPESGTVGWYQDGDNTTVEEIAPHTITITFNDKTPSIKPGQSYQNRNTRRDCCGFFQNRSKNISWTNCNIYFMHGMGVVSQFSENLRFKGLTVAPRKDSLRTATSWADNLHFSGCKGKISVQDSVLGSSHDDAINVHGTHLLITDQPASNKLKIRFMHNQTYGFEAFVPGDQIDYVSHDTLIPYASNTVKEAKMLNPKEMELTLAKPNPPGVKNNDAVENVTWTASVHVKNTTAQHIPTRGFLLTTRQPVLIENCTFIRTGMPGILVEDDASGWYESGVVRDMTIKNNKFIECAEAVIQIVPHAPKPDGHVHKNITIKDNIFELKRDGGAIRTRHTGDVKVSGNTFTCNGQPVPENKAVDVVE